MGRAESNSDPLGKQAKPDPHGVEVRNPKGRILNHVEYSNAVRRFAPLR